MSIIIIPSIDIKSGKIVQLRQGKDIILEDTNIDKIIDRYQLFSEVNLIDIDSALSQGDNKELIKYICSKLNCNVGGGIRNIETAKGYLDSGAKHIIIGTKADVDFLKQLPKEKVIVALDIKEGKIATHGWTKLSNDLLENKIKELELYCSAFLITNIDVEGLGNGTNIDFFKTFKKFTNKRIIVAGGITTLEEIKEINKQGLDQVLGLCISSGKIDIVDALISIIDFDKLNGLIPTIVQDNYTKEVLMLAYSTKESLKLTFQNKLATYYSRSRQEIWTKGLTSGNIQEMKNIYLDCDNDTLLFMVKQKGFACHKGTHACFG